MYTRNKRGLRTVPWGTPDVTGLVSDDFPSRMTVCSRCDRNDSIHPRVLPVIPIASTCSLSNRRLWAILSNAFAKSSRMASVWVLPSSDFNKAFAERRSCDSHERLFLKPCWALSKMLFKAKCLMTWELTICSMTLEHIEVRDIGRYMEAAAWSPFLKMGTTLAFLHSSGTMAC